MRCRTGKEGPRSTSGRSDERILRPLRQLRDGVFEKVKRVPDDQAEKIVRAALDFYSALELFLKCRLMREHWALIVAKPQEASLAKFRAGDFRSVTMDEAIERLEKVADEPISPDERACFRVVRDHRNRLVHFFHERYTKSPPDQQAIQEVVSEQLKAWFYLHRLLTGRWGQWLKPYAGEIRKANQKIENNRTYLAAKYDAIRTEIRTEIERGVEYVRCHSCRFEASRIDEQGEPLYEAACRVCGAERNFLRVPCPKCGQTITVEDMGEAECPNEDFETNIEWLVEKYGPRKDPKEDTKIAYCSNCERAGPPTAIPFRNSDYLCLYCLTVHDSADNCDYCGALTASLGDDSYLTGCVMCNGKFGSESFARE